MPQTAAMRGLANAFEPLQALRESASYLRELRTTFRGNLGLAAAAYNAGPGQVDAWLAGRRPLPFETQAYVRIVTGYAAEAWTLQPPPQLMGGAVVARAARQGARCVELAKLMIEGTHRLALTSNPAWGPWGVQLAGNWSEGGVLASYERCAADTRRPGRPAAAGPDGRPGRARSSCGSRRRAGLDADALCAKLRAAGGACIVIRNPRG